MFLNEDIYVFIIVIRFLSLTLREVLEAPATYVQSLVNRVVNNISFRCNNLILKYVEEDIVLSVNIKHLSMDSVNGKWEPSFSGKSYYIMYYSI